MMTIPHLLCDMGTEACIGIVDTCYTAWAPQILNMVWQLLDMTGITSLFDRGGQ